MYSSATHSSVNARILAITVSLLSLTAQLVAQTSEHEQTLKSLRDIDIVVRYGHVDGQEESWQSDLLQRLEVITNDAVLEVVNRQLDEFIKAFKDANPPPQKAQNTPKPQ